jgi:outer membrane immunogenic protein
MMVRGVLFSAVALIAAGSASAADLSRPIATKSPPPLVTPAFTWTGAYVGLNGGVDWENTQTQYSYSSTPGGGFDQLFGPGMPPMVPPGPLNVPGSSAVDSALAIGFLAPSLGKSTTAVGIVGGQWGYNYQIQQYVLGFETDLDWVGGAKTTTFTSLPNGIITLNATQTAGLEALGTVRARLGYAIDRNLFFVTGGLAYGEVKASTMATAVAPALSTEADIVSGSASGWRVGYTVGGGYEYAFTNNLTGKIEYLFYNLGTANYSVAPANSFTAAEELFINASQKFDGNVLRVGLNWKY